jgi:hypothetical protein
MTPDYCDLRGYDYMPLHGTRLFGSKFYSLARRNPRAGLAGLKLWWEAWNQCPAASLPNDDFDLADLAGFGEDKKAWAAAKATALHGFVLCSDGRLYHPTLSELAMEAYDKRLIASKKREGDRERLRNWREQRKLKRVSSGDGNGSPPVSEAPNVTRLETPMKRVSGGVEVKGSEDNPTSLRSVAPLNRGTRLPIDWKPGPAFCEFATELGLNPDAVAARFRDHWHSKAGKDACKTDWLATWRNWCRSDAQRATKPTVMSAHERRKAASDAVMRGLCAEIQAADQPPWEPDLLALEHQGWTQ